MLYQGKFHSLHRDKEYTIKITTNNSTETEVEFTCGPNPFTTQMNTESATIYSPIKSSSATIEIVGNGYMYDLYSSTAKQNKVALLDSSSNIIWTGYTQPNAYSVPFDHEMETYTVEALDGLGILQYFDFTAGGVVYTDGNGVKQYNKRIRSFLQIVKSILNVSGCYSKLYWHYGITATSNSLANINPWDFQISEANFFDEDNVPMKNSEVLEEICKYCGVSAVAYGENVYFIDYDSLIQGVSRDQWREFDLITGTMTNVSLTNFPVITGNSFTNTGSTLTLDNTYSKVTIKDSMYTVDKLFPDMFDDDNLVNVTDASNYWNSMKTFQANYLKDDEGGWREFWGSTDQYSPVYMAAKWYRPKKGWKCNYYTNNGSATDSPEVIDGSIAKNYVGCTLGRFHEAHSNDSFGSQADVDKEMLNIKKGLLQFNNYLCFHQNRNSTSNLCLLETIDNDLPNIVIPKGTKLLFNGSLMYSIATFNGVNQCNGTTMNFPYFPSEANPGTSNEHRTNQGKHKYNHDFTFGFIYNSVYKATSAYGNWSSYSTTGDIGFIRLSLKIGEKYISSLTNPQWSNSEVILKIPVTINETEILKPIVSNVTVDDGIDEEGYCVRLPDFSGDCYVGKIKIKIYSFPSFMSIFPSSVVFLKDFDLKLKTPTKASTDERETDTEYSYENDANYINELKSISYKICTWDNKQMNNSAPIIYYNGGYEFINSIKHKGWSDNVPGNNKTAEELACYKIAKQYCEPRKKLTLNLFSDFVRMYDRVTYTDNGTSLYMIPDTISYNYKEDSAEVNLVEKYLI